ncbi:MAG: hypothetical protein ACE15C_09540 [Phycisphaerae bacterium]
MAKRRQRFIDGIHNYCDKWCERCDFTGRCRVFDDTERSNRRHRAKGRDPDDMNVVFKDVSRNFEKTFRMLARWAKKNNIDLDQMAKDSDEEEAMARRKKALDKNPLVKAAMDYMSKCHELLKELKDAFNTWRDEIESRAEYMDVRRDARDLAAIREAIEVVGWDHTMIPAKVRRAMSGKYEADLEEKDEYADIRMEDATGSAHVARKCLIRSQAALSALYEWDELRRDRILDLLVSAQRMQKSLEKTIPQCISFKWPQKV